METIRTYCEENQITIQDFSKMTDVSASYLYTIVDDRNANVTRDIMQKIYRGTLKEFGEGLLPEQYLNIK